MSRMRGPGKSWRRAWSGAPRGVLAVVAAQVLLAGCASSRGVSNYSSVAANRPYVIPEGVARTSLGTKVGYGSFLNLDPLEDKSSLPYLDRFSFGLQGSVVEKSLVERMSWEVSDGFYLKYQFNGSNRAPVGIRGGLGGVGYGSGTGFVLQGLIGAFGRIPLWPGAGLEISGTYFPYVGEWLGSTDVRGSVSFALIWQAGERSHWRLFTGARRVDFRSVGSEQGTWAVPLGAQYGWRPDDQWEFSAGLQLTRQLPTIVEREAAVLLGVTHYYSAD